jgi:hypothetical protein
MLVELDVFSGRENPHWHLDERSAQALQQLQRRLVVSAAVPPEPPPLGYRGFYYVDVTGRCRAYKGYVQTSRMVLGDPSFSIELFLLDRLPDEFTHLRKRIASQLGLPQ